MRHPRDVSGKPQVYVWDPEKPPGCIYALKAPANWASPMYPRNVRFGGQMQREREKGSDVQKALLFRGLGRKQGAAK
jgi:hypothetical protein